MARPMVAINLIALRGSYLFIFVGCGIFDPSSSDHLIIMTDRNVYVPDDTVKVSVINKTGETLYYNLCFNNFQLLKGTEWITIIEADYICQAISYRLSSGRTATAMIRLQSRRPVQSGSLEPGMYRIRFNSIAYEKNKKFPEKKLVSNTFEIVNK